VRTEIKRWEFNTWDGSMMISGRYKINVYFLYITNNNNEIEEE
jgi:hypothetical protein